MNKRFIPFYSGLIFLVCSCSNTKYLPAGESLYTGAKISVKTTGKTDKTAKTIKSDLATLTRPLPNKSILGLRFKLWIYNIAGHPKKEKSLRGKLKYKVGEPPVLLSDVNLDRNTKILEANVQNQGFFQAATKADTIIKKRRATAVYSIETDLKFPVEETLLPIAKRSLVKFIQPQQPPKSPLGGL